MLLFSALDEILQALTDSFILTMSGRITAPVSDALSMILSLPEAPKKIVVRTILVQESPCLQLNAYTQKQHFTKNIPLTDQKETLRSTIGAILQEPFSQAHLQTPQGDLYIRMVAGKGDSMRKYSVKRTAPSRVHWQEEKHDVERQYMVTPENSSTLLRALGICNEQGKIIPSMQAKYRQINHFLSIAATIQVLSNDSDILRVVDCGCGKAYLSLALYHWLHVLQGKNVVLTGIDTNKQVIAFCQQTAQHLGYEQAQFLCMPISSYPLESVDLVIALHACDTATDDALALALRTDARAILAAPCCHHYVNAKLRVSTAPHAVSLLLRDGITRERFADLLTDSMRRDILSAYGYSASLIEFVAPEHTTKNIMIRAEKSHAEVNTEKLHDVREQIRLWNTGPRLAELMNMEG